MQFSFLMRLDAWQLALILFLLMIISIFFGVLAGKKIYRETNIDSTALGALFTLFGLLLAFTFSMAVSNHGMRRDTIIEEANDIGTAVLRADLYRENDRKLLRADFKNYIDARIEYFAAGPDIDKATAAQQLSGNIQQQIWKRAAQLSKDSGYTVASMQMIPALNSMIDITTTRQYGNLIHLPDTIIYLLIFLACTCAFYMGYMFSRKGQSDPLLVMFFSALTCLVVFVILDLDRPRRGFITLADMNNAIVELKQQFSEK
jgi:hypothetical protein